MHQGRQKGRNRHRQILGVGTGVGGKIGLWAVDSVGVDADTDAVS